MRRIVRKLAIMMGVSLLVGVGTIAGQAATTPPMPETDMANGVISLSAASPVADSCTGEDGLPYTTFHFAWSGPMTDLTPGSTDYSLSVMVSVTSIDWDINMATMRGLLWGSVALIDPATGLVVAKGQMILVTQGFPSAGAVVPGRGFLAAGFGADDLPPAVHDDNLFANVEFMIDSALGAKGQFGDKAPFSGIPNYSVVTNQIPKFNVDGIC